MISKSKYIYIFILSIFHIYTHMKDTNDNNNDKLLMTDIKYKLLRLLIFIIFTLFFLKYLSGLNLTDFACLEVTLVTAITYMFIDTYYPTVLIKNNSD